MARTRPLAWSSLPSLSPALAVQSSDVAGAVAALDLAAMGAALARVFGGEVRATVLERVVGRLAPGDDAVEATVGALDLALRVEPQLAVRVAERVLGLPSLPARPGGEVGPALRAATAATLLHVLGHGASTPPALARGGRPRDAVLHRIALEVNGEVFEVRVAVSCRRATTRAFDVASLGDAPLRLEVVGRAFSVTRAELAEVVPGALVVCEGDVGLAPRGDRLTGTLALAAPTSESALLAELGESRALVLTGPTSLPWDRDMASPDAAIQRALGDAEVVVRVEVGSLTLPAKTWAALAPGDVLTTDARVGDEAVLRAGGVVIARGELCDVDGRLGVRITERPR